MNQQITSFWEWMDKRHVSRRIVLFLTLYLTVESYHWAAEFAASSTRQGIDIAAIIAAVTAPLSILQGHVFKTYTDSKSSG